MSQTEIQNAQSIDIKFQGVSVTFGGGCRGKKKTILQNVSSTFKSGELTAILGPSGSGKTTLLNILTGLEKNFDGKVSYISENKEMSWEIFKKQSRYIQQEDALQPFFTVLEIMSLAIELKLERKLSHQTKQRIMDDVLISLDLLKTKETRCANLTGGERKRFSIALELVNNPRVMFLDELTTGLDIVAALQCTKILKNQSKMRRTIVCTIHQPSSAIYEMFDHVYLLAGGRCVYQGDPMKIVNFFSKVGLICPLYHSPADFAMEVMSNEYGKFNKRLASVQDSSWRKTDVNTARCDNLESITITNPPSEVDNFRVLLKYCILRFYKDWFGTLLKFVIYSTAPILIGLTFFNSGKDASKIPMNLGMIVFVAIILFYCSLIPAVLKFPFEILIIRKEYLNGWYKIRTYYVSFIIINLLFQMFLISMFSSIVYVLSSQPLEWNRYLMFEIPIILFCFIGEDIGLVLGISVDPVTGTFACIVIGALQIAFCGFFILYIHMSPFMYHISQITFSSYLAEGILHAIYGFHREKLECPDNIEYCHYRNPKTLLIELQLEKDKFVLDIFVLVCHVIFLFTLAYFLLKRKVSSV